MEAKTAGYILHSAEHMFARALQNMGLVINVLKADTFREDGRGILLIKDKIPFDKLLSAQGVVNDMIPKGLSISEQIFEDIDKAKAKYPSIRLNEQRLKEIKNIRVVKIGDFDICACKHRHVQNTLEIVAFSLVGISYLGGDTEVEFKAATDAIKYLTKINGEALLLARENNFKPEELADKYDSLKKEIIGINSDLDELFIKLIKSSQSRVIDIGLLKLTRFNKVITMLAKDNPQMCIVVLSNSQLLAVRGKYNTTDLEKIGKRLLYNNAFVGDIRNDFISGKILNYEEARLVLDETSMLIV